MKKCVLFLVFSLFILLVQFSYAEKTETIVITNSKSSDQYPNWKPIQTNYQTWEDLELYFVKTETSQTHYTIMDRNMGASERYNQDSSNQNTWSYGYYYQWWNNYWFEACYEQWCTPLVATTGTQLWSWTWSLFPNDTIRRYWRKQFYIKNGTEGNTWMKGSTTWDNIWWWWWDTYSKNWESTTLEYRMWPCPEWYHIPSVKEWRNILKQRTGSSALTNWSQFSYDLLMPYVWRRLNGTASAPNTMDFLNGAYAWYWTSSPSPENNRFAPIFFFDLNNTPKYFDTWTSRSYWRPVRCVKNEVDNATLTIHMNWWKKAVIAIFASWDNSYAISSLWTPTKTVDWENVEFLGWYTTDNFVEWTDIQKWDIVENLTDLYARRNGTPESVIYTYDPNGGQLDWYTSNEIAYTIWETINPTTSVIPTRNLYIFAWWFDADNNKIESHSVSVAMNLYAQRKEDFNNNNIPDKDENPWIVTVNYVYTWWRWETATSVTWKYLSWLSFSIASPDVTNYTPDVNPVEWTWKDEDQEFTVIYSPVNDINHNWIADEEDTRVTVIFSGSGTWWRLSGQVEWPNILTWLTLEEAWIHIPEPMANSGYVFGWWEPKTPNSWDIVWWEYTATWKVDSNNNWIADEDEKKPNTWWSGWWRHHNDEDISNNNEDNTSNDWDANNKWQGDGWETPYPQELVDAYKFAYNNWITTQSPISNADMNWNLTRIAMAKMLSKYAINVLWMEPDETRVNEFNDVVNELDKQYDNWVTLAYQLWIMWINMPNNEFRPFDLVTRWEFGTALSRILWWDKYNVIDTNNMPFYEKHLKALKDSWIMSQVNPSMNEIRWYVMIMLLRSAK